MNSRKDEILNEIVRLKADLDKRKSEQEDFLTKLKDLKEIRDQVKVMLDQVKQQFNEASDNLNNTEYKSSQVKRIIRSDQDQIEQLHRELARIQDAESLQAKYQQDVEAFRNSCLDATWRKENRTDGLGALEHQIDGAIHLAIAKRALLGDKRGLGKTLTSLIWCDLIEAKKVIVLNPSDTMDNYIREIQMWTPHRTPIKIGKMTKGQRNFIFGPLKQLDQFMVVINYEAWRRDPQLIQDLIELKADTLIEDEAHRGKTLDTLTAEGIQKICFGINQPCPDCGSEYAFEVYTREQDQDKAVCRTCGWSGHITELNSVKNVLAMTGTPILNKPQELFPICRQINPQNFKNEEEYLMDFCMQRSNRRWGWGSGGEEQVIKKIGPRFLARDRRSAGVIIPPAQPVLHKIEFAEMLENYPKQAEAYRQVREHAQLILDQESEQTMSMIIFLEVLLRLRQVLVWPAGIKLKQLNEITGEREVVGQLNVFESIKVDKAEELIKEIVEEGERVVVFSQFKDGLHELDQRLRFNNDVRSCVYDGSTSQYQRNEIQLDFDIKTAPDKPRWDVVLGNYKAMGEGLNLNAATQMIILDREWNPGREEQAMGRIDRLGQTRDTTIHTIQVEKTVDSWMAGLIEEKRDLIAGFESEANVAQSLFDALRNGEV